MLLAIHRKPLELKSGNGAQHEDELGMPSDGCKAVLAALADTPASCDCNLISVTG